MSNRSSAVRYAKALFDVALKEGGLDQADRDLSAFADLFHHNTELRKALVSPAVPVTAKRKVIDQLLSRTELTGPTAKLVALLAERDRLELLPELAVAFQERLMDHRQIVRAEIVTAAPISDDRVASLQKQLARVTGRTVTMSTRVDPALIGGVVAKVGTTVYDASVATQLAKMRTRLVESV
jgi:F-type H+-transporting ATPase subunit delta